MVVAAQAAANSIVIFFIRFPFFVAANSEAVRKNILFWDILQWDIAAIADGKIGP